MMEKIESKYKTVKETLKKQLKMHEGAVAWQ